MVSILGIGWISEMEYGCAGAKMRVRYGEGPSCGEIPKDELFLHPFRNFGRLDGVSRMTCCAAALALKDAGVEYSPDNKQDTGIIGTNRTGSLKGDVAYFRDYLDSGRKLARGNLFIYTLPSSPLGEAAIHFGLRGPLMYAADADSSPSFAIRTAADIIRCDEADAMLAGYAEENEAIYFLLSRTGISGGNLFLDIEQAAAVVDTSPDVRSIIDCLYNS